MAFQNTDVVQRRWDFLLFGSLRLFVFSCSRKTVSILISGGDFSVTLYAGYIKITLWSAISCEWQVLSKHIICCKRGNYFD